MRSPTDGPRVSPTQDHDVLNSRTFGVEEEFLLVNGRTGEPVPVAEAALAQSGLQAERRQGSFLTLELQQEQIEAVSPPCSTMDEIGAAIRRGRQLADDAARSVGARAAALATSPFAVNPTMVPRLRFQRMAANFGLTLKEQLTCGFHIHVFISSAEEGVAVLDRIRIWLPVVLALSTNSPFWRGTESGYDSFRYQAWNRWPTAGPCERFGSAAAYHNHVRSLMEAGVLLDEGMVYFDARLSRNNPTMEVRIADVLMDPAHATVMAAVVRALVERAVEDWHAGIPAPGSSAATLRLAAWRASKSGVDDVLLHPLLKSPCPAGEVVHALLNHVGPALARTGDEERVNQEVAEILAHGTGSRRQKETMLAKNRLKAVVFDAVDCTHGVVAPLVRLRPLQAT